ncbi:Ovochymase-2-like 1 [Homarus americanus]|uniref:Ovochymase-2-like 1 n=1 Tax=Homarus americanus TaxID=6706 RepID=A0A8J5K7X6_HOMAM|nr:Ovochymase-2-like 1 [Homarus americanus]
MVEGRRGSVVVSQNKLLLLFFLLLALSTSPVSAQQQQQEQGRFFRGIFSLPEQCFHNGVQASCTFVLSCLMRGDTPVNKCGGSFIYTCCLPTIATVRSDAVRHINLFNRDPPPVVNNPLARLRLPFRRQRPYYPPRHWSPNRLPVRVGPVMSSNRQQFSAPVESRVQRPHSRVNEPECGIERSTQFSKRIIGGDEANFGEARLDQITVHLGEFDTKDTGEHDEPLPKETFTVVEKRIHPSFKYMLTQPDRFDVAVLRLNRPVVYRDNIIPICLPDPSDDFIGEVGIVAGWGKTDNSFVLDDDEVLTQASQGFLYQTWPVYKDS